MLEQTPGVSVTMMQPRLASKSNAKSYRTGELTNSMYFRQALQLNFYGDGIVEGWRGTQHSQPSVRCQEGPDMFKAHFGSEFDSHAWGVAGNPSCQMQENLMLIGCFSL